MNRNEFKFEVEKCYALFGQELPERDTFELLISELESKMFTGNNEPKFTDNEIRFVLKEGKFGKFGEVRYLSAVNIWSWFFQFQQTGTREIKKNMLSERNELSEQQQFEQSKKYLIESFEKFKKTGVFDDLGNCCYNFLADNDILQLTVERKNEYMEQAKEIALNNERASQLTSGMIKATKIRELINAIEAGTSGKQKVIAKKLALTDFFKGLIETETEINDLFND